MMSPEEIARLLALDRRTPRFPSVQRDELMLYTIVCGVVMRQIIRNPLGILAGAAALTEADGNVFIASKHSP